MSPVDPQDIFIFAAMVEVIGYFSAVLIGVALGLIGGGGSTLAVPVLVYLMGINPVMATAYSLFIVGSTSLLGAIRNLFKGKVDLKTAVIFGIPSIAAVYITRSFLLPAIPEHIATVGSIDVSRDLLIMVLFAVLMVAASYGMIKPSKKTTNQPKTVGLKAAVLILLEGAVVGTLTGLVGAGGGFLIIPALVVVTGLSMKKAVGTSLLIISAKSLIGFLGDVQQHDIDWSFLLIFTVLAMAGIWLGTYLNTLIDGKKLKTGFGWFVLVMGAFILVKEFFFA